MLYTARVIMGENHDHTGIIRGTYYAHIDGLRAVAVLAVLLFHAFPEACRGGFIGVDVFFVISGYLITHGLMRDLKAGEYSIGRFYVRRIRRILPAYAFMLLLTLLAGTLIYYGDKLILLVRSARAGTLFYSNIYFLHHSGYFEPNAHENPLLNLWSLSVEEQFYIFFPLLLAGLYKWWRNKLKTALWFVALCSLVAATILVQTGHPNTAFYHLPFRAWELLAGSLTAIYGCSILKRSRAYIAAGAFMLLAGGYILYSSATPFPGACALLPVICAVCLILFGNTGITRSILEWSPTVFIGKISYSLYLFHWPALVYCHYLLDGEWSKTVVASMALLLALLLSIISWRWVETPIRLTKWAPKRYFIFASACLVILLSAAQAMSRLYIYEFRHPSSIIPEKYWNGEAPNPLTYPDPKWEECENLTPNSLSVLGKDSTPVYLLWGDSHAMALSPGFYHFSERNNINGLFINRKHVLLNNSYTKSYKNNAAWLDNVLRWLEQHPELKTVILGNRWASRARGNSNEIPGSSYRIMRHDGKGKTKEEIFRLGVVELCERLHAMKRRVIILADVPEQGYDIPSAYSRCYLLRQRKAEIRSIPHSEYLERQSEVIQCFREIEERGLAHILWTDDIFYPQGHPIELECNGRCLYVDDDHLSPTGARFVVQHWEQELIRLLTRPESEPSGT